MPIKEKDPWRDQYFEGVACPDDVAIPTDDGDAYHLYPRQRWVYNKLLICETQGLEHSPHGVDPPRFPVFSKPIYNLRGMGTGSQVLRSLQEYERAQAPGYLWMPLLEGEHVSTDWALLDGRPVWWRHTVGHELGQGMFDYWQVLAEPRPELEAYCSAWLTRHLKGYTGIANLETIGGTIIEAHLRMSDQFVDLYGPGWVSSVVDLYARGAWQFAAGPRRPGYSVVLFGEHGPRYGIALEAVEVLRRTPHISSVQITFHLDKPPDWHAMPPGGFRLAIVNCWSLAAGLSARERLRDLFQAGTPGGAQG